MKSRQFLLIVILLVSSSACSSMATTPTPSDILFSDDFSDMSNKWDQVNEATRMTDYYNGAYRITVNDINSDTWGNPDGESFTDTRIEVDATKNGGPDNNDFGIICRYIDLHTFYYGVVSSDGYYGILKMTPSGGTMVGTEKMAESDLVARGAATNHIRFDCIGSTLTLYVNGAQVDQQTDAEYTAGNVGLIAGTFTDVGTDILFDNFFVYKP
jgi:hypothetical protein